MAYASKIVQKLLEKTNLFFEIRDLLLDMRDISHELQAEKKDELIKILERCLSDLKKVVPMDKLKGGKEI